MNIPGLCMAIVNEVLIGSDDSKITYCEKPGVIHINESWYCGEHAADTYNEEEDDEVLDDILVAEDDERDSTISIQKHKADWT